MNDHGMRGCFHWRLPAADRCGMAGKCAAAPVADNKGAIIAQGHRCTQHVRFVRATTTANGREPPSVSCGSSSVPGCSNPWLRRNRLRLPLTWLGRKLTANVSLAGYFSLPHISKCHTGVSAEGKA
jgi:hypothetical protein